MWGEWDVVSDRCCVSRGRVVILSLGEREMLHGLFCSDAFWERIKHLTRVCLCRVRLLRYLAYVFASIGMACIEHHSAQQKNTHTRQVPEWSRFSVHANCRGDWCVSATNVRYVGFAGGVQSSIARSGKTCCDWWLWYNISISRVIQHMYAEFVRMHEFYAH